MSKGYLLLYNLASAAGWAFVFYKVSKSLAAGDSGAELWSKVGTVLTVVQSAAALEIVHSMLRLVRSPLLPTFLQVGSRLAVLWMYMVPTAGSHGHWANYLCIGSWALVEVPRYLFYAAALNAKGAPHKINGLLFFLRYHLFMVLYPSGISGELLLMYNAYPTFYLFSTLFMRVVTLHMALYAPLAPFMVFNMWTNKKRAYKKRAQSANPRPLKGLIWPITDSKKGDRSTTKTNRAIWAASTEGVDAKVSGKCGGERNWRFKYQKHVMSNVEVSCQSKANALKIAHQGLAAAYKLFEFKRGDEVMPYSKAMAKGTITSSFQTHQIRGNGTTSEELKVPYGGGKYQGAPYYLGLRDRTVLKGLELREQLAKWVKYGTIEQSAADAIAMVATKRGEWLDLSNHYFILLGATSAMGPLYFLLEHGANIIAVDLNRDFIWKKLFDAVRNSSGRLIFPVKEGVTGFDKMSPPELAQVSGCDLLAHTPEIANWLTDVIQNTVPENKALSIGNYTYLDGALHVQLSLACDGIIKRVCEVRKDTMIAFLCTPTDDHVITNEAYKASKESLKSRSPGWAQMLDKVFCGKLLGVPNYKAMRTVKQEHGDDIHIIDGIAVAQGPNYALAKRMQHWRAVIAFDGGHVVSSNVAPSTATESVVHNAQFAAAYGGMHHFQPMEVMYQRTSLAVMGALMIHDFRNVDGAANPKSKIAKSFRNPFELFSWGSFHGGVQRCSYKINDIGVPSALSFYMSQYKVPVAVGLVNFILGAKWLVTGNYMPF